MYKSWLRRFSIFSSPKDLDWGGCQIDFPAARQLLRLPSQMCTRGLVLGAICAICNKHIIWSSIHKWGRWWLMIKRDFSLFFYQGGGKRETTMRTGWVDCQLQENVLTSKIYIFFSFIPKLVNWGKDITKIPSHLKTNFKRSTSISFWSQYN